MSEKEAKPGSASGIFDVSKPGKTAPSASGKAIIITNRPVIKDPMVNEVTEPEATKDEASLTATPLPSSKLKIAPIHPDLNKQIGDQPVAAEPAPITDIVPANDQTSGMTTGGDTSKKSESVEPKDEVADPGTAPSTEDVAKSDEKAAEDQAKREAELQKLADSHKYYLPINQTEKRKNRRAVIAGVVLIVILGVAWADISLDSGIISVVGIKAPTHFFK